MTTPAASKVRNQMVFENDNWTFDTYEDKTGSYVRMSHFENYHWIGDITLTFHEFRDMVDKINDFHNYVPIEQRWAQDTDQIEVLK